jgi:hypothetical protein
MCQKESVAPAGLNYCAWGCFGDFGHRLLVRRAPVPKAARQPAQKV